MKPSEREEEYMARMEFERKKRIEQNKRLLSDEGEKRRLRELHHMKCPKCGFDLIEIDYRGHTVDKCSGCDGIWLDAGEIEQVAGMEKSGLDKLFQVFRR